MIVELTCLVNLEVVKKSITTAVRYEPTSSQEKVKNSAENPSGPGALPLGKERRACLTSEDVGMADKRAANTLLHRKL